MKKMFLFSSFAILFQCQVCASPVPLPVLLLFSPVITTQGVVVSTTHPVQVTTSSKNPWGLFYKDRPGIIKNINELDKLIEQKHQNSL